MGSEQRSTGWSHTLAGHLAITGTKTAVTSTRTEDREQYRVTVEGTPLMVVGARG